MKLGCGNIYNESDVEVKYCSEKETLNSKTRKKIPYMLLKVALIMSQ
jgi:hypothetical protein